MATSTTNLGLTKPSVNDAADIAVLNANFDKIDTAVAGKAPDGYGLGLTGSHLTALADANEAQRNGWYLINKDTANGVGQTAIVRVDCEAWAHCVQTAYSASYSYSTPMIMRRVKSGGTWKDWEWVNPPMTMGVEYRTTERWNGKAVYTMVCAYAPSAITAGYQSLPTNASWTEAISAEVNWYDTASDTWRFFPSAYHANIEWMGQAYCAWGSALVLELGSALCERMQNSTKDIRFKIKYVKD